MKTILIASLLLMAAGALTAQAPYDVKVLGTQILARLTPALNLTDDQQPQVEDAVTNFLTQKAEILPLKTTDPSAYISKFNSLSGGLVGKLKIILLAKQMTSFLGLKPKPSDTSNVLSHLFY